MALTQTQAGNRTRFEWMCDTCGFTQEFRALLSAGAWGQAKSHGWRAFKDGRGAWKHKCATCIGIEHPEYLLHP